MKKLLILSIFASSLSCHTGNNEKPAEQEKSNQPKDPFSVNLSMAQIKNAGIVIGKAEKSNISSLLKVNGKIDVPPQNIVSISFPLGGYLKSTKLLPGMPVRKGEALGVLEDPQYIQMQQDYLSALIKQEQLQKEFNRQQELNAGKASSDKVLEQITSDYQTQRVLVKALAQKLTLIGLNPDKINADNISKSVNVYSPINGFVSKVDVNIGKYVSPTDVLFELINPDDIHLALTVFQKDVHLLSIGQLVIASTANNPDKKYEARIILISRDIAPDGGVEVHCHFKKMDRSLIPGMYMNAVIETHAENAITVPEDAIVMYEKKQYVFLVKDSSHFQMVSIATGPSMDGRVSIASENGQLFLQNNIVLKNAYALLMKMKNTGEGEE
jgi:cobalt-zinc-cadmium efflux system membrane fusion protein